MPRGWPGSTPSATATGSRHLSLRQLGYGERVSTSKQACPTRCFVTRHECDLVGSFFLNNSRGETDALLVSNDRIRGLKFSVDYDNADEFNGINQARFTFTQGIDALAHHIRQPLCSRQSGKPDFSSISLYLSRQQALGSGMSIFGALEGSYAFDPLLAAQECSYGGRIVGRVSTVGTHRGSMLQPRSPNFATIC